MKAALILAGMALIAAGCDHGPIKAEKAALQAVSSDARGRGLAEFFPAKAKTESCSIRMGGPVPNRRVPGTCTTSVKVDSNGSATVRFRESWDREDFHAQPGSSRRRAQSHAWTFVVAKTGRVIGSSEDGDVPPQYVP